MHHQQPNKPSALVATFNRSCDRYRTIHASPRIQRFRPRAAQSNSRIARFRLLISRSQQPALRHEARLNGRRRKPPARCRRYRSKRKNSRRRIAPPNRGSVPACSIRKPAHRATAGSLFSHCTPQLIATHGTAASKTSTHGCRHRSHKNSAAASNISAGSATTRTRRTARRLDATK